MLYLGIWLFANRPIENEEDLYWTQIPYATCYFIRLVLVCLIWMERVKMLNERRETNEEFQKWLRYLGYEPKLRPVVI